MDVYDVRDRQRAMACRPLFVCINMYGKEKKRAEQDKGKAKETIMSYTYISFVYDNLIKYIHNDACCGYVAAVTVTSWPRTLA